MSESLEPLAECIQVVDHERRMGSLGRTERFLDPDVELCIAEIEPDPAPAREVRWLRHFDHLEHLDVERTCLRLRTTGRRDLNMVRAEFGFGHTRGSRGGIQELEALGRAFIGRNRDGDALKPREIGAIMQASLPRLLVALRPRNDVREALPLLLPDIPWAFLEETAVPQRSAVEAMLVGSFSREYADFDPASTPRLAFVQRLYTGVDGFPFDRFPENVRFAGNVGAFAPFVAEHALGLALAAARDLHGAREMVRTGRLRPPPQQRLLYGASAVILGYGEIGREIARRLAGFETRVHGLSRTGAPATGAEEMFPAERLKEAVARGDLIFEARPLTKLTAGSIGKAELEAMRPEAIFVNVGRAGTVDEEALYRHLEAHPSFRAALDVWWNEDFEQGNLPSRFPFDKLPNFVGTPHSAGVAPGGEARVLRLALENLGRFFRDGRPAHVVDRREYTG
jgi:D-3-phosphoglycerate dehydrogenase / 2-oxoglutarate reductase